MNYLIIGSGGREHALAWRLMHDGSAAEVYVAPGNGGIDAAHRVALPANDFPAIGTFCAQKKIDVVVVGPEAPLVDGLVDYCEEARIPVFGPRAHAALLEGSKLFAKNIMEKYGVPTAGHWDFTGREEITKFIMQARTWPLVIKLDGLAAGKGVGIPENREDALAFIRENVTETSRVFVEEFIDGEEASVLGISDGETILPFTAAQDHKRVFDGDKGPNTGGMGAYAPAPVMTRERLAEVHRLVLAPVVQGMKKEGTPFKGILYAGIIVSGNSIKVLEFNVRFGDPEAQVILPLLDGKLGDLIEGSINGTLNTKKLTFRNSHAITVVMASGGYPGSYPKGKVITGIDRVDPGIMVFHAGTTSEQGKLLTSGGRVLNVTALGNTLREARDAVYRNIGRISFEGAQYRSDIGYRAL